MQSNPNSCLLGILLFLVAIPAPSSSAPALGEEVVREITNADGQKYVARLRQEKLIGRSESRIQISEAANPDEVLLNRVYKSFGSPDPCIIQLIDVHKTDNLLGFVVRRQGTVSGQPLPDDIHYFFVLASNDVEKLASELGYEHLPVRRGWTEIGHWYLDNLESELNPAFRLVKATTLEVEYGDSEKRQPLRFEFSIDKAEVNGQVWKTRQPRTEEGLLRAFFKPEEAKDFIAATAGQPIPAKFPYNQRPHGEFIEQWFGGPAPMREFFRKYAKDEAELSEFVRNMEMTMKAEAEVMRQIEERIKAGPPKPSPEEIEAERQRKLAEVEWRKKFDAEEEAKLRRTTEEYRRKREELLRRMREGIEDNDAE